MNSRLSIIELGTNTILMLTARIDPDRSITILSDEHQIARLGRGVDASRRILPEAFDRVERFLLDYRAIAERLGSERILAFGTSALRDAANREEFVAEMIRRTGITIDVIDGSDEAELTYRGALFGLTLQKEHQLVLDIGGGSTEIALGSNARLDKSISIDIGAVRISERYLKELPPSSDSIEAARSEIASELARAFDLDSDVEAIGVAGTVTTLGAIDAGMQIWDAEQLDGWKLSAESITEQVARLERMTLEEIAAIPQIPAQRADVILGGSIILEEFMRRYALPSITVSTRGLRYGMLMREVEK
jgi:exopolyphosphatase/guanosine-5'-triphosphate,3'-diphosphate pyrophosphatase